MNSTLEKDHIIGSENAPLELMEYGDYECPYCAQAYYVLKDIQKELGKEIKYIFRNFPLVELHPYAMKAALAAEAANAQGKFWEMHDALYENQENLEDSYLLKYAKNIGLDMEKFEQDFGKDEFINKIKTDYSQGLEMEVNGTPAFFINGEFFDGDWSNPLFVDYLRTFIRK